MRQEKQDLPQLVYLKNLEEMHIAQAPATAQRSLQAKGVSDHSPLQLQYSFQLQEASLLKVRLVSARSFCDGSHSTRGDPVASPPVSQWKPALAMQLGMQ